MKLKTVVLSLAVVGAVSLVLSGCGDTTASGNVELTLATNQYNTEPAYLKLKELAETYNSTHSGVTVDVQILTDYEPTMKTKMAANDLPDLFFTHGWSTTRYAEYLEPLQDHEWAAKLSPLIKDRVTAEDGKVYVLPMEVSLGGVVFNSTVLDQAGVDWKSIQNWDDFQDACVKIKAAGKTPIALGGLKDGWTVGNFMDFAMPSFLVTDESNNYRKELLDGSFDWNKSKPFFDMFNNYYDSGYFNSSALEGTNQDIIDLLAHDDAAFAFTQTSIWTQIKEINHESKIGIMPVPAYQQDDEPVAITGEGIAIGAWNKGKHKKEALDFIDWLSKPENINAISDTTLNPTGLQGDGYESSAGPFTDYYANIEKYRTFGYFDRDYLPSGMWDTLTKVGETLITKAGNESDVINKMQSDYDKLSKQ